MQPIGRDRREALQRLFAGFPGLHGIIDSALEGVLGEVWADHTSNPRIAHVVLADFHLIAGDPGAREAGEVLRSVPAGETLAVQESWEDLLFDGERPMQPYDRFAFRAPASWDRERLAALRNGLPEGYVLERVTAETVAAFEELNASFVNNFRSNADFLERGVGFGVRERGASEFVAGCSSYTISSRSVEFEIETHLDYQGRGLALVTGAALIAYCIENGLEPCWDAAHEGSALLAERLGFVGRRPYLAYRVE